MKKKIGVNITFKTGEIIRDWENFETEWMLKADVGIIIKQKERQAKIDYNKKWQDYFNHFPELNYSVNQLITILQDDVSELEKGKG